MDYEYVNHPAHYNDYDVECIEMMRRIWGDKETAIFCKLSAFKYRMRLGQKPNEPIERDLEKEKLYLSKYKEFEKGDNNAKEYSILTSKSIGVAYTKEHKPLSVTTYDENNCTYTVTSEVNMNKPLLCD